MQADMLDNFQALVYAYEDSTEVKNESKTFTLSGPEQSLIEAARMGQFTYVQDIIESNNMKGQVSFTDRNGDTPLHFSARSGNDLSTKFLLNYGAEVNASKNGGLTPLMAACAEGHYSVAKILIKSGANVNAANEEHENALHYCAGWNQAQCAKLLLKAKIKVDQRRMDGRTPLQLADSLGYHAVTGVISTWIDGGEFEDGEEILSRESILHLNIMELNLSDMREESSLESSDEESTKT